MNDKPVRTRFAPSPTGAPHIGNMRTALYAWLLAKGSGGQFILRIEDTDQQRQDPSALAKILSGLRWLNLQWDEGLEVGGKHAPYIQSQRKEIYGEYAQRLIANGFAYHCDCSAERLELLRKRQAAAKQPTGYDGFCRSRTSKDLNKSITQGIPTVVRIKIRAAERISFVDTVYGDVAFDTGHLKDFVVLKSDGMPTYHLAHVVDDYLMEITHVIRGEEWISSTPRHILIMRGLNIPPPNYIHVPLILGKDKAKLSKRHGAISLLEYRAHGYLPEVITNYLALLGWSDGTEKEFFTRQELIAKFSPHRIQSHPAVFDPDKLTWMNGTYIRSSEPARLAELVRPFLEQRATEGGLPDSIARPINSEQLLRAAPLIQERITRLDQVAFALDFFFTQIPAPSAESLTQKAASPSAALEALEAAHTIISTESDFTSTALEAQFRAAAQKHNQKAGQFFYPIRIAITGRTIAPPLFQTIAALGRQTSVIRIEQALKSLQGQSQATT